MSSTNDINRFNRFELKYIVHRNLANEFIRSLDGYVYADPNSNGRRRLPDLFTVL